VETTEKYLVAVATEERKPVKTEIVLDVADAEKPEEIQIETLEKYAEEFTRDLMDSRISLVIVSAYLS
jgi:hypothetical protein